MNGGNSLLSFHYCTGMDAMKLHLCNVVLSDSRSAILNGGLDFKIFDFSPEGGCMNAKLGSSGFSVPFVLH